jgi:hypothetical protein
VREKPLALSIIRRVLPDKPGQGPGPAKRDSGFLCHSCKSAVWNPVLGLFRHTMVNLLGHPRDRKRRGTLLPPAQLSAQRFIVVHRNYEKQLGWLVAMLAGALLAAAVAAGPAQAGGLFDLLFGGSRDEQPPSPPPESYAEPSAPVMPAPLGPESVRQGGGSTGRTVAYCVRLCDGQHFPLDHMANATPVETCRAMCPASKTKVYFGSEIGAATAKDGAHYADLDTAFIYRKQLVANCTCNGKDAFGLAPFDMANDPTLRPGDIVSTKDGLMAYSGKNGNANAYTPVNSADVAVELNPASAGVKVSRRSEAPPVDDDPGTIAMPQAAPPPVDVGANMHAPVAR